LVIGIHAQLHIHEVGVFFLYLMLMSWTTEQLLCLSWITLLLV